MITIHPEPDPYERWARLREDAPVQWFEERSAWLVLSHAAALVAYRSEALSTDIYSRFRPSPAPIPSSFERPRDLNSRLRALVHETMPTVEWMRETIIHASAPIIDAAIARAEFDFARDLAEPLAAAWLTAVFGLNRRRQHELIHLIQIADGEPDTVRRLVASDMLRGELLAEISHRRAHPGSDVLTRMCTAWQAAGADDLDLAAFLAPAVFSVAEARGAQLLTTAMSALLQSREAYDAVARGPFDLALDAAREAARWEPINPVSPRRVIREFELAGATLRPDDTVLIVLPAVCRDPAQHPEPDRFALGRTETSLAFGIGAHYCLGRTFALTTTAAILHETLATRRLTIALSDQPQYLVDIGRACRSLPVRITRQGGIA